MMKCRLISRKPAACLVALMMSVLALASLGSAAQQIIQGEPGEPEMRSVINFDGMAAFEAAHGPNNEPLLKAETPFPGPAAGQVGTDEPTGDASMGFAAPMASPSVPPPQGGFNSDFSPGPETTFLGILGNNSILFSTVTPDTHGAVGPDHVMTVVNTSVRIQDRSGTVLSTVTLQSFWSSLRVLNVYSPKVVYDAERQRWIFTALSDRFSANASVLIAVSQSSNPRGRWNLRRVDIDPGNLNYGDFPHVGFNKDWIVVTVNVITFAGLFGRDFAGVNIYAFDKQNLYTNGTGRFTLMQDLSGQGFAMAPAVTHDALQPTMYLVETDSLFRNYLANSSRLRISTITGPVGAEVLTLGAAMVDTGTTFFSSDPLLLFNGTLPQLGGTNFFSGIYGGDARIQNVVMRNGSLWCTHTAWLPGDAPDHAGVHWYQITPSGSIIQHGVLEDPLGSTHYAYPSIAVNRNNDALIGFSRFSTTDYPSAAYAFRACNDSPGTVKNPFVYKPGESPYNQGFIFFTNGWGSYSATVTDPVNDTDLWTVQEYAAFDPLFFFGNWGVQWAKVGVGVQCAQVGFALNTYQVIEGAQPGYASIEVLNLGGVAGSIDYATSDGGTATPDDYTPVNGTLTFASGQTSTNFFIPISDDPLTNGQRTINLSLFNPGGGAQLGFLSNAVLVIEDDEEVIQPNVAGEFNFSAHFTTLGVYRVTENESCQYVSCPNGDDYIINTPDRTVYGAMITVIRTNGNTGKVMVDYETAVGGSAIANVDYTPISGTLVFDHLQQSTNFIVRVASDFTPNGNKFVRLVLSNPRPVPEEEAVRPGFLLPSLGPGAESGLIIMEINHGLVTVETGGSLITNSVLNFERAYHRVDEYTDGQRGAGFPACGSSGWIQRNDDSNGWRAVTFNIIATPLPVSGEIRIRTSDRVSGTVLVNPIHAAGSDLAESPPGGFRVWDNPLFTDSSLQPITNLSDYVSTGDEFILTFSDECRKAITVFVRDDPDVEFNEDLVIMLRRRPNDLPVGFNTYSIATIVADDQPAGALDREWNRDSVGGSQPPNNPLPGANNFVRALMTQPDGKTLLGGDFTAVNSTPLNYVARMNANGLLDSTFNPGSGADAFVSAIALYPSNDVFNAGKILIGGAFSSFNGAPRRGIARLNPNGSVDNTFNPGNGVNTNGIVRSISLQPDGQILIAGTFFEYDDQPRNGFARLNGDGSIDTTFDIGNGADGPVLAVAFTPDPAGGFKVVVGGEFRNINGQFRSGVAVLNTDGSVDQNFNPGGGIIGSAVNAVAVQADRRIIIAGSFDEFNAVGRTNIARLNSDGSLDRSFDPGYGTDDSILTIALQPDGKAIIGGIFTTYNATRRIGLARLRLDGKLDTSFMDTAYNQFAGIPNALSFQPPNSIRALSIEPSGNVMIGGSFTNVGGNPPASETLRNTWTVYTRADKRNRWNIARLIGGITPGPGNVNFISDSYFVDENAQTAYVELRRTDGRLGSLAAEATNVTATAVGTQTDPLNADFVSTNIVNVWAQHTQGDLPGDQPASVGDVDRVLFPVPILDDFLREGNEQVDLNFLRADAYITLGGEFIPLGGALGRSSAKLTITDNEFDPGTFEFTAPVFITNENAILAVVYVIRSNGSQGNVSVDYLTRPSLGFPATPGDDYRPVAGTLTFDSGQTIKPITIQIVEDTLVEFDEFIDVILTNATSGAKLPGGLQTSIALSQVRIVDNDFLNGRVNFTLNVYTNAETDGVAVIGVSRTGGSLDAASIQYETFNTGSATNNDDYQAVSGILSWSSGESGPKTFTIPLFTDGILEGLENFRVRLFNPLVRNVPEPLFLGGFSNAIVYIRDTDAPGSIAFSQPIYQADENATWVTINLVRSSGIAGGGVVTFSAEPDSALVGTDFTPVITNVTFAPGQISAPVFVRLNDDTQGDGNKSVRLRLSNPSGVTLGPLSVVTLLLIDNESVNEKPGDDDPALRPDTEINGPIYSMALQVTNGVIDGRIIVAGNFTEVNRIPRSGLARLMTNGVLDSSFNVGAGPSAPANAVAVQRDGKVLVGGFFSQFNGTNAGRIVRLHVDGTVDSFFNAGSGADNPVYSIVVQPDEKVLVGGGFNTFNGVSRSMIVRLNTNGVVDQAFGIVGGPNDTVYAVALQSDGKVVIGGEFTSVHGVTRNRLARLNSDGTLDASFDPPGGFDGPVRAIVVQADGTLIVGGSFINANGVYRPYLARVDRTGALDNSFMAGLTGANNAVYALALQVDDKVIVAGDFTAFNDVTRNRITRLNADGTIDTTINFGTGANAFITSLLIQPDRKIVIGGGFTEYDDQPRLRIARLHGGSTSGAGNFTFVRDPIRVGESDNEIVIAVKREGGTTGSVGVNFQIVNGTAIAGVDFQATNGTLTFPEGETLREFRVVINNNSLTNADRFATLLLSGYSGGATSGPQPNATLLIINDESAIGFTQDSFNGNENAVSGNATLTVRRNFATNSFVTVNFATVPGGTATAGSDYVATNGSITFAPGELTRNFNVRLINDGNIEGNETIRVMLTSATSSSGGVILNGTNATVTIVEDDFGPGQFVVELGNLSVREDGVTANITVIRTNGSTGVASVRYRTADNSASAGSDFVGTNSVIAFGNGETRRTVSILIFDDSLQEGLEDFTVQLFNATGASLGTPASTKVTILDNDTNLIVSAGAFIVSESGPVNNFIDPGETVTVALGLQNLGSGTTTNLVGTLQSSANVAPQPPTTVSYGALVAGGGAVQRNFTFTASGASGSRLLVTLSLNDNGRSYGQVTYPFTLGGSSTNNLCNNTVISLNDSGAATNASGLQVYPSTIVISNIGGNITRVLVSLLGVSHTFPDDIDVLLEAPNGQSVMLMSDAGGGNLLSQVRINFSDAAPLALPDSGIITNNLTYRPGNYTAGVNTSDSFPLPAPQPVPGGSSPYTNTSLALLNGGSPNGEWKLYVVDDTTRDSGSITGWCLTVETGDPVGVAPPPLAISRVGANVVLSWPASASAFVLQESEAMTASSWQQVTAPSTVVGGHRRVTLPLGPTCRSYRLAKP